MAAAERIILGSGYIHIGTFVKGAAIPNPEDFCNDDTLYAYIKGGATLEYSPEFYEAKDDMGKVAKSVITAEEVTLKSGIMTFEGNTLEKLCDTARVSERASVKDGKNYRVVKIGGAGNARGARYIICFHHVDKVDGDIYLMIIGQNQAGFTLAFAKDNETVVDAEFHALPMDGEGTLIVYTEEIVDVVTIDPVIAPESGEILGKNVADLQDNINVTGDAITGVLKYVTDYNGYSSKAAERSGNFFAFKLIAPENYDSATVELVNGTKGAVTLDSDKNAVVRITDKATQQIKVVVTVDGVAYTKVYSLAGLTLNAS